MTKRLVSDKEYWVKVYKTGSFEVDTIGHRIEEFQSNTGDCFGVYIDGECVTAIPEREKVTIPKFVADAIEKCKPGYTLLGALEHNVSIYELRSWGAIKGNQEKFALAWIYGYEIDKEKLYTVEIPNPESVYPMVLYKTDDGGVILGTCYSPDNWEKLERNQLTESEIKKDFDWAWQFAVPVEEEE